MRPLLFLAPLVLLASYAAPAAPAGSAAAVGLWTNPRQNVRVRTEPCGERLCGTIVHASASALASARAKGVTTLEGTRVFEDLRLRRDGVWQGQLYVPDRGARFASTLRLLDDRRLEVRGCILRGLICKSQIWTRVAD